MEFSTSSNNMLTSVTSLAKNQRIRLSQFLESFNQFREISSIFGFDSHSNDRRYTVFHASDGVGFRMISDSSCFHQVLINTNKSYSVSARNIGNRLNVFTHHQDSSLNRFLKEILFLSWLIIRSHDSNFLSSGDSSGEDSSEGKESRFISGRHHLGDVHDERSLGVTGLDTLADSIVLRSFVKVTGSIFLSVSGRWQVENKHFQYGISSIKPF